jgi:hypothetical protein
VIESDLCPISLTSTLSKVLDPFVGGYIMETIKDKLDERQHGALKGRSTTLVLIDILHHWRQAVDNNEILQAIFIDYAKVLITLTTLLLFVSCINSVFTVFCFDGFVLF